MLSQIHRLTKKEDFERVKKQGKKLQGRLFGVLVLEKKEGPSRFGFIFSTKLSKKATARNRAKRVLREAVRIILPRIKPGYDILFLGKQESLHQSFDEAKKEVEEIFKKLDLVS